MRVMLPRDMLERCLDGPFDNRELRPQRSAHVGEKLAGQDVNNEARPVDIGHNSKEGDETVEREQVLYLPSSSPDASNAAESEARISGHTTEHVQLDAPRELPVWQQKVILPD